LRFFLRYVWRFNPSLVHDYCAQFNSTSTPDTFIKFPSILARVWVPNSSSNSNIISNDSTVTDSEIIPSSDEGKVQIITTSRMRGLLLCARTWLACARTWLACVPRPIKL